MVVQEARGRAGSEGTWRPYGDEGRDAYDTVEWAAAQPWSDGNVGLYGSCALGYPAIQGAVEAPPHLKAVFAYMTAINYHSGWTYSGGAFELGFQLSWVWTILAQDTISRLGLEPAASEEAAAQAGGGCQRPRELSPPSAARRLPRLPERGGSLLARVAVSPRLRRVLAAGGRRGACRPHRGARPAHERVVRHVSEGAHGPLLGAAASRRRAGPRSAPTGSRPVGPQRVLQQAPDLCGRARLRPRGLDRPRHAGTGSPSSGSTTG